MSRQNRCDLIKSIEEKRGSKVIVYVTSDRHNLASQIAGDVVSIIHDHIQAIEATNRSKLDLFLYSRGGQSDDKRIFVLCFHCWLRGCHIP